MIYELAKELKDAGFPQEFNQADRDWFAQNKHAEVIHFPILSELIEACGEDFSSLYLANLGIKWGATSINADAGLGATPEEAVARLWLALNKP